MHIHCYDDYGNVNSTTLTATGTTETFTSSATYSADGNFLQSVTDSLGKVTEYNYDTTTKLLNYIENANGNKTAYKYDGRNRTTNVYLDADGDGELDEGSEPAVEYLYTKNRLSGIETATTTYTLTYDSFGNLQTVKADNNTLATYEYAANNGKLLKLTYGNGDYEEYSYDSLDRLVKVVYNGTAESGYELQYDANGRLYQTIDYEAGITHIYEYDSLGRLIRAWQKNTSNGSVILGVENSYDAYGRAKGSTVVMDEKTLSYTITYDEDTNLITSFVLPVGAVRSACHYDYDNFDRVVTEKITMPTMCDYYTDYAYQTYTDDEGNLHTSNLVSTLTLRVYAGGTTTTTTYGYSYDNIGNITAITKNGSLLRTFVYDSLNRLQRENDYETLLYYVYSYDNAGNILSKEERYWGGSTKSLVNYSYSTSEWGDLLTNYNGTTIDYDAIGNPLTWRNATSMSWDRRALQSMTLSDGTAVSYQYNADGIRTKKTVGTNVYSYVLDGSKIQSETVTGANNYTLYYTYDASGSVIGFHDNNTPYFFQKNLQGDVIRILGIGGNIVTEYKYDAWGNVLSVTGSLADTIGQYNPFRYRGYYYDTETGFYYLNSRYYDPQVGRFINADGIIGANGGIMGYNLFAYCNDNPVMYVDPSGYGYKDFDPGTLEYTITYYWYLQNCVYDVGFIGDIEIGTKDISIQRFIQAMQNVNFQAPVVLIDRYNALVEDYMRVDYNGNLINPAAPEYWDVPSVFEQELTDFMKTAVDTKEYLSKPENVVNVLDGMAEGLTIAAAVTAVIPYTKPASGYIALGGAFCMVASKFINYLIEE